MSAASVESGNSPIYLPTRRATQTPSPKKSPMRAIQGGMSHHPTNDPTNDQGPGKSRRKSRTRPHGQSAQVLLRMSPERRQELKDAASAAGYTSVGQYLLALQERDTTGRSACAASPSGDGSVPNAESPGPRGDQGSHAEARRTVAAVAG